MTSFSQEKLSRTEWEGIEVPSGMEERRILDMISKGYNNLNIRENDLKSLFDYLKITPTPEFHMYLFYKYFKDRIDALIAQVSKPIVFYENKDLFPLHGKKSKRTGPESNAYSKIKLKKSDIIRLNTAETSQDDRHVNYETLLLNVATEWMRSRDISSDDVGTQTSINVKEAHDYYGLYKLSKLHVPSVNIYVKEFVERLLSIHTPTDLELYALQAEKVVEGNSYIYKYQDRELYNHQKQVFHAVRQSGPKFITYIAPTGTGKTLTPLGIIQDNRVIFICAARHVGLALAKAAVSTNKKIAIAFGCKDPGDVRLHYYAVSECTRNKRTGNIRKVDNTAGEKVELMICDIQSYIPAMRYMLAFNESDRIVLYWDEPTITMDYDNHELHGTIHNNWIQNVIPNVVLSSATLPNANEMRPVIQGFCEKFPGASTHNVASYDCKKTIQLLNSDQNIELPHHLCDTWEKLQLVVKRLQANKTVLRYLDVSAIMAFVKYLNENSYLCERFLPGTYFESMGDLTMTNFKIYYLEVLYSLEESAWAGIHEYESTHRIKPFDSTIHVTSSDSWTLTDGPTIYFTENVNKIAQFCLKTANVPRQMLVDMKEALKHNSKVAMQLVQLEKDLDDNDAVEKNNGDTDRATKGTSSARVRAKTDLRQLRQKIDITRSLIKPLVLNDICVPNTKSHLERFGKGAYVGKAFAPDIDAVVAERILSLNVADSWKILLMMGIGVFASGAEVAYTEIMKALATEQRLYLIIADSDYIYGTNYQFCHAYLGKDTKHMTQDKTIQAMGRTGRGRLQQSYSVRLRDNEFTSKIFMPADNRPELRNINRLLST